MNLYVLVGLTSFFYRKLQGIRASNSRELFPHRKPLRSPWGSLPVVAARVVVCCEL